MSASRKVVHARVEFVDIAGLVAGSSTGEGLGNRFLAGIREVDALCLVLRAFEDPEVPGDTDPRRRPASARARAGPGRPGDGRDPARQAAQGGPGRQVAGRPRSPPSRRRQADLPGRHPVYRSGLDRRRAGRAPARSSC